MRVTVRIDGIEDTRRRLDDVGLRAQRPEPVLRSPRVRRELTDSERRLFASNRFSRNTARWDRAKRRRGLSPKRMQASGRLRLLLTSPISGNNVEFKAYNGTLTWGIIGGRSSIYYGAIWAKRDPKRRVVKVDMVARGNIRGHVVRYIDTGAL